MNPKIGLSASGLRLLVAANPVATAPKVREALAGMPEGKRWAALEKLVKMVGLDGYQAFKLQGLLLPELCVANLAGRNHQMSINRIRDACLCYVQKQYDDWNMQYWARHRLSQRDLADILRPSRATWRDVDVCVRHRMLYEFQSENPIYCGEPRLIGRFAISPLLVCLRRFNDRHTQPIGTQDDRCREFPQEP